MDPMSAPAADRRLDFRRAGDDEPGLVDDRQELQRIAFEQAIDFLGQFRRGVDVDAKAAGKGFLRRRLAHGGEVEPRPHAAPGQLAP